jgi:hypothetical protein
MASIAAPQLRRSKRKQKEEAAASVPETIVDDAPTTRKRARKAITSTKEPSITEASVSKKHDHGRVNESIPVRSRQHSQTLTPFLALPRELRDEIYKHVITQDGSTTFKSGSRNMLTRCGLVGVNAQISEEFLDALLFHAPIITTTVRNHNFAPVVTFLNRLSTAQLTKLSTRGPQATSRSPSDGDNAKPKRKILIILSYSAGAKDSRAHLNRWLDRFDAPDKRGKEVEFAYDGDGTYRNGGYKQRPRTRETASQRWNEEAEKIGRAAARSGRAYGGWGAW